MTLTQSHLNINIKIMFFSEITGFGNYCSLTPETWQMQTTYEFINAALTYTEYPLRMLKIEIRDEITEYDANGRGGACTKRCLCESVKNACVSLQMS